MWSIPIIAGPVPWIVYGLALAFFVYLLVRRPTRTWVVTAALGLVGGALVGVGIWLFANATHAFGEPLPVAVAWWAGAAFAAIGLAVVNLWNSRWWRKVIAAIGIVVFAVAATIGVNAHYGLNKTLGSLFGIVEDNPIDPPAPDPDPTEPDPEGPLYQTWQPPADMPETGRQGTQVIPATVSGFDARPAGMYLPPAALVENAPRLPLVIMMMGFPGNPDPSNIGEALDQLAARNKGLAPIVIVADQIGASGNDPACADSVTYGNAESYVTQDVVAWAKQNLRIIQDPAYWVIAGYSNGGGCAMKYMANYPTQWKNLINVSGEPFPGSEDPGRVIENIFGGDQAAFEAAKPLNVMTSAPPGTYEGVTAVFTAGAEDPAYIQAATDAANTARAVGMAVTYYEVPGAGHLVDALDGGLQKGLEVLYPVLGLSAP